MYSYHTISQGLLWPASLVAQLVKNQPAIRETPVWFLGREDPLEKEPLSILGLPWWLRGKRIRLRCERPGIDPGLGRSPGRGHGTPVFLPGESPWTRSLAGYSPSHTGGQDEYLRMHVPPVSSGLRYPRGRKLSPFFSLSSQLWAQCQEDVSNPSLFTRLRLGSNVERQAYLLTWWGKRLPHCVEVGWGRRERHLCPVALLTRWRSRLAMWWVQGMVHWQIAVS